MKLLFILFFIALCKCSFASTYYFSSSLGDDNRSSEQAKNPSTPWKTLEKLNSFSASIRPGDFILFNKGDVWTGTTLTTMCNGITFGNYGNGDLPVIDGGANVAINISRDFSLGQTIDGIAFKRSWAKDIVAQLGNIWTDTDLGMTNCKIRNCNFFGEVLLLGSYNFFESNIVDGTTNDGNGNGIWEHHKFCHHNTYTGNTISNFTVRGIWTMTDTHDCIFENNIIHDCQVAGIDLDGAYYVVYGHLVRNNKIYNCKLNAMAVENAFDCTINGNYMYSAVHSYISVINYERCEVMNGHGATNGIGAILNTTISGNIMIGGGIDFTSVAINIYKAGGVNVYNNSIYDFKSRFFNLDYTSASEVPMIRLVNNVFSTIESPSWYAMVNFSTNENVLAEDDYNCFFNNGLNDIYTDRSTGNQKSLAQYKAATGKGLHSISVNPLFVSTNDLHLQKTSLCIDAGKNVGLTFSGKAPDMGAYEYLNDPVNSAITTTACSATGTILREEWDNISGNNISNIPLQTTPTSTSQLTSFEGPLNIADKYGSRIRGYICPPQTGSYTFWIATDDDGELWLSTDDQPVNKVRIANVNGWTNYREWNKYPSQQSAVITLQAGKKYYVEALQKDGGGWNNLTVQWRLPDATMETPIAGSHLSPYVAEQMNTSSLNANFETGSILPFSATATEQISATVKPGLYVYPNPVSQQTTVEFALPEAGQTDVALYNTKGQLISKLFTGTTEANVKQDLILSAESLQNGVYILHLKSGKNNLTKKVIVMK